MSHTNSYHDCEENTRDIVKESVPSQVSEKNSDAKPPKQQIVEPMAPNKLDSPVEREGDSVSMPNVEKQGAFSKILSILVIFNLANT